MQRTSTRSQSANKRQRWLKRLGRSVMVRVKRQSAGRGAEKRKERRTGCGKCVSLQSTPLPSRHCTIADAVADSLHHRHLPVSSLPEPSAVVTRRERKFDLHQTPPRSSQQSSLTCQKTPVGNLRDHHHHKTLATPPLALQSCTPAACIEGSHIPIDPKKFEQKIMDVASKAREGVRGPYYFQLGGSLPVCL